MDTRKWEDGEPCGHPGCLNHITHPCEGCGRVGGVFGREPEEMPEMRIVLHKELTGCDCPNNAGVKLNMPITGYTCKKCGASKDRYTELKEKNLLLAASLRRLVESLRWYVKEFPVEPALEMYYENYCDACRTLTEAQSLLEEIKNG